MSPCRPLCAAVLSLRATPALARRVRLYTVQPLAYQGVEQVRQLHLQPVSCLIQHREGSVRIILEQRPRILITYSGVLTPRDDQCGTLLRFG